VATVRSLLRDRVALQVRSVDRLLLHAYMPRLMSEGLRRSDRAVASGNEIPVVRFQRSESKEEIARPYFERAERDASAW
jgi:hypothetical protein